MNAVSAFFSSGFLIQSARFLSNRNQQAEELAYQIPSSDYGVVRVADMLAPEGETSDIVPRFIDFFV